MKTTLFLFLLILTLGETEANADPACQDQRDMVVNIQSEWNFARDQIKSIRLPTRKIDDDYIHTAARANFITDTANSMGIFFDFPATGTIGLPYNIYRLELTVGSSLDSDQFNFIQDYSQNCTAPGISFFPNETIHLRPFTIPRHKDGSIRTWEEVNIKIWGRRV